MKELPFTLEKLESIAARWPTPFHIYDEAAILANARRLKAAFAWNKGFHEYFAVKAAPNPHLMALLRKEGFGSDCSSMAELVLAEAVGNVGEDIMFTSNDTPAAEFQKAAAQLKGFIKNLNTLKGSDFYNWIQSHCDVDLLLKMYAANVALGHWDDYWNDMNNFYLYFNSRDQENYKLYMLPYDYDNTLGTSHYCGVQSDSGRHDPYHWGLEECVLISKILEVTDFRERYTRYLKELSDNTNPYTGILPATARIRAWHQLITPYLENDTGEDMAIKDRPASWSNHQEYRVMEDGPNNWFRVKSASLESWTR